MSLYRSFIKTRRKNVANPARDDLFSSLLNWGWLIRKLRVGWFHEHILVCGSGGAIAWRFAVSGSWKCQTLRRKSFPYHVARHDDDDSFDVLRMAAEESYVNGVVPMEIDKSYPENGLQVSSRVLWDYSEPEPEMLKGFFRIRTMASNRIPQKNREKKFSEYDEISKAIKGITDEALADRKKIKKFLERKSYLFKTPLEDLPSHPSFLRDFGPCCKTVIEGLEVLTEVSGVKANLPPRGELKRKDLKPGTLVWAMKTNTLDKFVQATVLSIREGGYYKIRIDDGRGLPPKLYNPKMLAYRELSNVIIPVGTRIIARYSEDLYAGVIAEAPITTNKERYLIFFDDGYAKYITHEDIRVMCQQSNDVTQDMNVEVRQFVHEYLSKYPERPMLKLQVNQRIRAEYSCVWEDTRVVRVDCSMVELYFYQSGRKEWLYRGSTRLKLLYDELNNAEANRLTGKHRRHNIVPRKPHKPYVEYTREDVVTIDSDNDGENASPHQSKAPLVNGTKPRNTARKSTALKPRIPEPPTNNNNNIKRQRDYKSHLGTKEFRSLEGYQRNRFRHHVCSLLCREIHDPKSYLGEKSIFAIPLHLGWERQIRKCEKEGPEVFVLYRAPCGRHLRSLEEIQTHLWNVSSKVTIDYFSLDPNVMPFRYFTPRYVRFKVDDVTQGKENVKIPCINTWKNEAPPRIEYAAKRFPHKGVHLNEDKEFLVGCSCTDYCQNSDTCECQQITNYASTGKVTGNTGYKFRRLKEVVLSGIYECNDRCKCGPHCGNRVVQNGLQVRLQMFKTQRKGWGIRCLDDIEAGMFICIYAGQILNDQLADEEGRKLGDEYLAELDHIEVNERIKEGYESDVDMDETESKKDENNKSDNSSDSGADSGDSDSEYESSLRTTANTTYSTRSGRKTTVKRPLNVNSCQKVETSRELPDISSALDSSKNSFSFTMDTLNNTYKSVRSYYSKDKSIFVMDAKTKGNIGKFLNHSCDPNLFVQCVFVNTHDLRFHEVAFFAQKFIVAGTELTWDYNYEVGSVANKTMYCYCDSRYCRGRLL
ncbi:hypothetical protein JTE90_016912 [Oedothorax gibbosus]|uniref:Histone-lysine N-methyltransferase eggless n=1 Tax=Oedothorax gibbosus TaxID=931172 RepID=A0AAV6UUC7_9ARAC|nr:hypothetical protein JTE90_016912 [Oedothorax gibbosus]